MAKVHGPKFLALVEESRKRVGELSIEEVKRKRDGGEKFRLIDVPIATEGLQPPGPQDCPLAPEIPIPLLPILTYLMPQ